MIGHKKSLNQPVGNIRAQERLLNTTNSRSSKLMVKIAIMSPLPPQRTGESIYTLQLVLSLASKRGMQIFAIAGPKADSIDTSFENIETMKLWKPHSFMNIFTLFKFLTRLRPNIVHVQFGPHGKVYGGLFGEPILFLMLLLRAVGIKTTVTFHSTWMTHQVTKRISQYKVLSYFSCFAGVLYRIYMKLLDKGTDTIQLSTVKMDSLLKSRFIEEFDFNPKKVLEIPHPCGRTEKTAGMMNIAQKLDLGERKIILVVGFIRRGKGLKTAIKAMSEVRKQVDDAMLLIAGTPVDDEGVKYLHDIQLLCKELSVMQHVKFDIRFIPEQQIDSYVLSASVLLIPYSESVGASAIIHNYAGYGVPIVATNVGYHMKEAIGGNLILFKPSDYKELAEKLVSLLRNKELAEQVGLRQKKYAQRENWKLAAKRTIQYYLKTISTK